MMLNFRRSWLLCGAELVVMLASCSSTAAPTATVAPTMTSTVASEVYQIGDVGPAGGTIFITPSTVGNLTGLYFEAAPFASESSLPWAGLPWATGDNGGLSVPGASGTAIGDGAANTAAIASQAGNVVESSAAVYASEFLINGFSDWFLPSKDELNEFFENRDSVGGFSSIPYWSSSETVADGAWFQNFNLGYQNPNYKSYPSCVRPVRAFP